MYGIVLYMEYNNSTNTEILSKLQFGDGQVSMFDNWTPFANISLCSILVVHIGFLK